MNTNPAPILNKNARILLISNMNTGPSKHNIQSKKEMIYDTLKKSNLFSEIKIVSLDCIKHFNELSLSYYHCVIYDLLDHGNEKESPNKEIENYIKNGGNIVVTHDHVYALQDILGLEKFNDNNNNYVYNKVINANYEHDIWKSYFNLENIKTMDVKKTHGKIRVKDNDTQQVLHSYDKNNYLYLSTRKMGMGKAIFWNAGHTPDINEEEKKLLLNIVVWALKEEN